MTEVIAVVSQKGGVGKTTTVVSLGFFLAREGKRTLIIDLDMQNGSAIGTGLDNEQTKTGLFQIVTGEAHVDANIHETRYKDLHIIPFGIIEASPTEIESRFYQKKTKMRFSALLREVAPRYDFILLDSPSGSAPLLKVAMFRAHSVIIPLQAQPLALRLLPNVLKNIRELKTQLNPNLRIRGILLTMFDYWDEISEEVANKVWSHFPEKVVFKAVVPKNERFQQIFTRDKTPFLEEHVPEELLSYEIIAKELAGTMDKIPV